MTESGDFKIKLLCVNPIVHIGECLAQGNSSVFFSATLLPIRYYRQLLSNDEEDYTVYVNSPFSQEHRLLLAAADVTSRYTRRNRTEYRKILDYIRQAAEARKGNYIVFFPSYQYMNHVLELLYDGRIGRPDFADGSDAQKLYLQDSGIDWLVQENRMIGAIIVGTGLPMVCTEQEILKGYFDEEEQEGFAFAYQYPGMNKVMQAAGRVIRTAGDKGIILLLDDRFLRNDYRELFPREWDDCRRVTLKTVRQELENFWNRL